MNKTWTMLCICAAMSFATAVRADVIQLQPSDADLGDLEHSYYYLWKVTPSVPAGQTITGASLFIDNITDSEYDSTNILYLQLLSSANVTTAKASMSAFSGSPTDVWRGNDGTGGGNALGGYGIALSTYSDTHSGTEDITYTFSPAQVATLVSYAAAGSFGLGFDPDCHYDNDGVTLTLQTASTPSVPVPGALLLAGLGTAVVGWVRRTRQHLAK